MLAKAGGGADPERVHLNIQLQGISREKGFFAALTSLVDSTTAFGAEETESRIQGSSTYQGVGEIFLKPDISSASWCLTAWA